MAREPSDIVQLKLRLRETTRQRLEAAAVLSGRSLNSELVARLEEGLRADEVIGGDQQAWLISRMVRVMNDVSSEYGCPWWKAYAAWWLVFRSFFFMLREYRPARPPKLEQELSPGGWTEVQRWNRRYARAEIRRLRQERHRADVKITRSALKNDDAAAQLVELREPEIQPPPPPPSLNKADAEIWLRAKAEIEVRAAAWWQLMPTLQAVQRRRQSGKIS